MIRYFRAVSRNYVNMKNEEKWHLCKLMAFEALKRHQESLDGETAEEEDGDEAHPGGL